MAFEPGDVVLVPFPYRDAAAVKTRPAVVVSSSDFNQTGDIWVVAITSHAPRSAWDHGLLDWQTARLQFASTVRMLVVSVSHDRVQLQIGRLSDRDWDAVKERVDRVIDVP